MSLQSRLFRGDPKLEAAAVSDPAHIMRGARGDHVRKIQQALIALDGADLKADGAYGPATAAAVLAYKKKRSIINPSYQTQADDIVGRMTMANLDQEIVKKEPPANAQIQIVPSSFGRRRPTRHPALNFLLVGTPLLGSPVASPAGVGLNIVPSTVMEMSKNSLASFVVLNGWPGEVRVLFDDIAKIAPDGVLQTLSDRALIMDDIQKFIVRSGSQLGTTPVRATVFDSEASIDITVTGFFTPPVFHPEPDPPHAHGPSGRYEDVRKNPNNAPSPVGKILEGLCQSTTTPQELVDAVIPFVFGDKPTAKQHLDWYLKNGKGKDFVEDDNIKLWLKRDSGIRSRLKREIFPPGAKPRTQGNFTFGADEFRNDNFQFSFGAIDRVDFEVNLAQDAVRVWFQDRYEWHPVYPFYTFKAGDFVRTDNCLHAALVELQASGATDFWMKGKAEVPLLQII
jgi:hypothetical protein